MSDNDTADFSVASHSSRLTSPALRKRHMRKRTTFLQAMRFGVTGFALTVLGSLIYHVEIRYMMLSPGLSLTVATVLASCFGYVAHSRSTCQGHGNRVASRFVRFLTTSVAGYLLNRSWVFA